MDKIIITTPEELKNLICNAIEPYFHSIDQPQSLPDQLTLDQAVAFLNDYGFPTSKTKIYRLTSENKMPYKKFGNRLVFSKALLLDWAIKRTKDMSSNI